EQHRAAQRWLEAEPPPLIPRPLPLISARPATAPSRRFADGQNIGDDLPARTIVRRELKRRIGFSAR
ncbi:MAG TPA: hypothetical protein VL225_20605, partial [Vicinamibacterales bacterium]|nr:hypothetical protein [Vicinamibacterales bacterium]